MWLSDVIDRCLRKAGERAVQLRDPSCCRRSIIRRSWRKSRSPRSSTWWRTHQVVAIVLYTIATAHAWQIKEWFREPVSLWVFVLMGIAASVGGIVRGHLVFTDIMNRPHLTSELRRTKRVRLFTDVLMALLLTVDALLLVDTSRSRRC